MSRSRIAINVQSMAVADAVAALERKSRQRIRSEPAAAEKSQARAATKTATAGAAGKVTSAGAGEIRIIGGQWRRTRLPVAQRPGLRPTPDRVRETLFNWLGQDLAGWRCIDAFAGTGALGLEAASRGAKEVLMVEQDASLVEQLCRLQQRLAASAVKVQRGDAQGALQQAGAGSLDLILLDPPFDQESLFLPALQAAQRAVAADGWIYLEAPLEWGDAAFAALGLVRKRYLKAGAVHAHLLCKKPAEAA